MFDKRILIRGGGDLGSGVALRLWRAGFPVVIAEAPDPVAVRRTVAFAEAVYDGVSRVEEAVGRLVEREGLNAALKDGDIPVVVDPEIACLSELQPYALVDAILAKRNTGTRIDMALCVLALGPGFLVGKDCHAVVETNRGPDLGRVLWSGGAQPNSGEPGLVGGKGTSRVLRAPAEGNLCAHSAIGDIVDEGKVVASVSGMTIRAPFPALVRGLARDGLYVTEGMKVGDIDPRLDPSLCLRVSDKSLAIAGGVLEAVLISMRRTFR